MKFMCDFNFLTEINLLFDEILISKAPVLIHKFLYLLLGNTHLDSFF